MQILYRALFGLMFLLCLWGCTDKSALLLRTWKLEDLRYGNEIPAGMKDQVDRAVNEMKGNFRLTYSGDGTYVSGMGNQTVKGTWKLNATSTKITSSTSHGERIDYDILELNKEHFIFKAMEGKQEVTFVMSPAE